MLVFEIPTAKSASMTLLRGRRAVLLHGKGLVYGKEKMYDYKKASLDCPCIQVGGGQTKKKNFFYDIRNADDTR